MVVVVERVLVGRGSGHVQRSSVCTLSLPEGHLTLQQVESQWEGQGG